MKILLSLLIGLWATGLCAQQSLSVAGFSHSNSSGMLSWNIGELMTETMESNGLVLTQGLYQTRLEVTTSTEQSFTLYDITAFPNPAQDFIHIVVNYPDLQGMYYSLYNNKGVLLKEGDITNSITKVDLEHFPPSVYFIQVKDKMKMLQTFKIIKNY